MQTCILQIIKKQHNKKIKDKLCAEFTKTLDRKSNFSGNLLYHKSILMRLFFMLRVGMLMEKINRDEI